MPAASGKRVPVWAIAAGVGAVVVIGGAVALFGKSGTPAPSAGTPSASVPAPAPAAVASAPAAQDDAPRLLTISAVGFADSSDPRFASDPNALRTALREETRRDLIEKAVALYVQSGSLAQNYGVLREKLLGRSNDFIEAMVQEDTPQAGKDGLVSMTAKATVRVRDVQKSLNQMSKEERVDFIRNNGDPRIAVQISTISAADGAAPRRSQIVENALKEKIQSFGFRTWSEDGGDKKADFQVVGETKFKRLSVRLEASGLVIDRAAITSWTIKCVDRKTGEEIYYNTAIPQRMTWNSEDEAQADIGRLIGEEFSKGFFLQHFHFAAQKVRLNLSGLPDESVAKRLQTEIAGLRNVLGVAAGKLGGESRYELELAGSGSNLADLVSASVALPLNQKFGRNCFSVSGSNGNEVSMVFDTACKEAGVVARLDSTPPTALFEAPAAKREAIVKNPDVLKKLAI